MPRKLARLASIIAIFPVYSLAQSLTESDQRLAQARLLNVEIASELVATCPAEIYQSRQSLWDQLFARPSFRTSDACGRAFTSCLDACIDESDATACAQIGHLLEATDNEEVFLVARYGYALACAGGNVNGCTNRGGGIRNAPLEGDPLSLAPPEDTNECLFATFTTACNHGEAWGCAMLGQAYQFGEGTTQSSVTAATYYSQACALAQDPTHASCQFAARRLTEMDR